jgi:hypothetical protein
MDLREALHTIARRHCMERHMYWEETYRQLEGNGGDRVILDGLNWSHTEEAYATFPRCLVWQAILAEVERLDTHSTLTIEALREELADSGWRAQTAMTTGLPSGGLAAMAEEREEFASFVRSVPASKLEGVEPLQSRRVFRDEELQRLWESLDFRWGVKSDHYWWPLREGVPPPDVVMFHTDWLDGMKFAAVREILFDHGINRIWELREFGEWGCEQHVSAFEPAYTGEEGYWTSSSSDWLVYASHESSVTLAGEWLVASFRQRYPDCDQFSYEGPMSTPDLRGTWKW